MEFVPGIVKAAIALFILGCIIAIPLFIGQMAIQYWYVSVPIIGLVIWGIVALKRQKTAANRV